MAPVNAAIVRLAVSGGTKCSTHPRTTHAGSASSSPAPSHSAGGHLAVWAAGRSKLAPGAPGTGPAVQLAGAISLAGVLDLRAAAREKIVNALEEVMSVP
jgi:hypothetical protein